MKNFTILILSLLSFYLKAQVYSGTLMPTTPAPGATMTVNFALTSGNSVPNLIIYLYNSYTHAYAKLSTTSTFNSTGYYAYYTVPLGTPNNTIMQFTIGTDSIAPAHPNYYGVVTSATVLPIIFKSYTAVLSGTDKAVLNWELESTDKNVVDKSIIYKSVDGINFLAIDTIKGNKAQSIYNYTDMLNGSTNSYYYKIACLGIDGDKIISNILYVNKTDKSFNSIKIIDNMHIGNQLFIFGVDLNNYKNSDINIFDATGRKFQPIIQNSNTIGINNLRSGIYYLKISNNPPLNFIVK